MPLDANTTAQLIAWICWVARERDTSLTTVQLVKYLYLADLYQARRAAGETLTGWPWAFVHFGPYCTEAIVAVDRAVDLTFIDCERYDSRYEDDKEFCLFRPHRSEEPPIDEFVSLAVQSALKKAIAQWADDTAGLLDHVYFATEPMQGIRPKAFLDFTTAQLPTPLGPVVPPLKLSEKKLRKGRDILARLRTRTLATAPGTPLDSGPHDDAYCASLAADESGETPQGPFILEIGGLDPSEEAKG